MTFSSTHHALRAEELLEAAEIDLDVVPMPREITAECGLAMKFPLVEREKAENILTENKVDVRGIYTWNKENKLESLVGG